MVRTCPMFSLVARQAMTDMAFVGPMAMALALGTLALFDDRDEVLPRRGSGGRGWSWPHHPLFYVTMALFVLLTLPQLIIDSIQLRVRLPWGGRAAADVRRRRDDPVLGRVRRVHAAWPRASATRRRSTCPSRR